MRDFLAATLAACVASVPAAARAGEESGLLAAARVAYALPVGDAASGLPLGDLLGGDVPVWAEVGWRFERRYLAGAYFQYGPAVSVGSSACGSAGPSCSGSDVRLGAEFLLYLLPGSAFQPWLGIGFGYEWANVYRPSPDGQNSIVQYRGWEFVNLQLGGDFEVAESWGIGPYVAFAVAEYDTIAVSSPGTGWRSSAIPGPARRVHEWFQIGIKGTFGVPVTPPPPPPSPQVPGPVPGTGPPVP